MAKYVYNWAKLTSVVAITFFYGLTVTIQFNYNLLIITKYYWNVFKKPFVNNKLTLFLVYEEKVEQNSGKKLVITRYLIFQKGKQWMPSIEDV